jgi:hypothetical protein
MTNLLDDDDDDGVENSGLAVQLNANCSYYSRKEKCAL